MTLADQNVNRPRAEMVAAPHPAAFTRHRSLFISIGAFVVAAGLLAGSRAVTPAPLDVAIDMAVSGGSTTAVWVNEAIDAPATAPVISGVRTTYHYVSAETNVASLRVDPTDMSDATVTVHGITITQGGTLLARIAARTIAGWIPSGIVVQSTNDDAVVFRTTTADPILVGTWTGPLGTTPGLLQATLAALGQPSISAPLMAFGFVLLLVAATLDSQKRPHVIVAGAVLLLAVGTLWLEPLVPHRPAAAAIAVSRATFVGDSTRPAGMLTAVLVIGAALVGGAVALLVRRRGAPATTTLTHLRVWHVAAAVLLLLFVGAPDLRGAANAASAPYLPHWDVDNLLYWRYLLAEGRWPMRDFWHPYGGSAVFDLPLPAGATLRWLYSCALGTIFFVALGLWRGAATAFVGLGLLVIGRGGILFEGEERYLLAPVVLLAYVAGTGTGASWQRRALFWSACALALFIEPPQLVYAGIPIAAIWIARALTEMNRPRDGARHLIQQAVMDFGPPLLVALAAGLLLHLTRQLSGYLELYGRLDDAVAYSAWPVGLPAPSLAVLRPALVLFPAAAVLVALGVYEFLHGGARRQYGEVLAGLGLVTLAVMQKHFMRPMEGQLVLFGAIALLVLAMGWPGRRSLADCAAGTLLLGVVLTVTALRPGAAGLVSQLTAGPTLVADNTAFLVSSSEPLLANRTQFAPERFARYQDELRAIDLMRQYAGGRGEVRLFALSDEMPLYVLAGQTSVWISNMYDASPLYRQQRVVDWLRHEQPPFAVFQHDHLMLDGFQMAVRVPLVYAETVASYVPLDAAGRIQILRHRSANDPLALAYWRDQLGATLDVGRIPSVSSYAAEEACQGNCADVLDLITPTGSSGVVPITLNVAGMPFTLQFSSVPGETRYTLVLDRLWFWNVAKRERLPRSIDSPAGAVQLVLRTAPFKDDVLY